MGTPDFAVPSLQVLIDNGYKPVAVVTGEDKARGRGRKIQITPIKKVAVEHEIPVIQPSSVKNKDFAEEIKALNADLIVVVAFRILPPDVFTAPTFGSFNLHGSILPAAVMMGADKTGLTTFFLKKKVDTGNILLTCETEIGPNETAGEIHDRLKDMGASLVLDTVKMIDADEVVETAQDDALATPAPKIFRDDCRIDWGRSAQDVHNHIRGLSPRPTAWTEFEEDNFKVYLSSLIEQDDDEDEIKLKEGEILVQDDRLFVGCEDGPLEILELQRPNKKRQESADFLRGFSFEKGGEFGVRSSE